jgi:hypothetical protein
MKFRILVFGLFASLALAAPSAPLEINLGRAFTLGGGGAVMARYAPAKLRVAFVGIVNDSRCPKGANCVWEGDATVRFLINGKRTELHTGVEPREIPVGGLRLRLTNLEPERGEKGRPRVTLLLSK